MKMIERFGEKALDEVGQRILELEERDQHEASRLWREIRQRIELLLHSSQPSTRH